ncbi:MAG: Calx-beta domain-containing protein, partial [Actinomycetota bacterium]
VAEGNAGTITATFVVSLSGVSATAVTIDWTTADGTATTADADYVAGSGTLTFNPGQTSKNVSVTINGDTTHENDETFTVGLSNPSGATISDASGTGTITNDDTVPKVSIANAAPVAEGDTGTTTTTLTVSLSAASALPVTVDWATADGTATTADADYVAGNGTLTFNPGQTSKNVSVTIDGDTTYERKESLSVVLSNVSGATLGTSAGSAAITNDDPAPSVAIGNASVIEGDGGTTTLTFTLTLTGTTALPAVARYVTSDSTATAGSDYTAAAGTLTFAVGETSKTVTVTVNGDMVYEPNETLEVDLTAVSDVQLGDGHAVGTIKNDDPQPTSLTVHLVKKPAKIKARGALTGGAVDGMPITVILSHRTGGKWVTVAKRTVKTTNATGGTASYIAAFTRPAKGTYRFTVRFKGDATHLKSVKSFRFTL